ncbi:MAG: hypothetical protein QXM02_06780 [Thermoproteota archaeon]
MSQVQIQIQKSFDEKIREHLKKEAELYVKEDSYKLVLSQKRRTFRKILKEKELDKKYRDITEKLKQIRKNNNLVEDDTARKNYYALLTQKLRVDAEVKSEKEFIEVSEIVKLKAKEFRSAYKSLREDFETNIKPNIPL